MGNGEGEAAGSSSGLCSTCCWVRVQASSRGARFLRCARAETDAAYLRYPPLPVVRCDGFEPTDA